MNKKVLIVDDDYSVLDAISLILDEAGYHVKTTTKGEQTYNMVREFKPDLILLDVLMSGNDGRHICKKLKTNEDSMHIPIIMISAHPSAEKSIKECGADDFIAKPFETVDLLELVSHYVS